MNSRRGHAALLLGPAPRSAPRGARRQHKRARSTRAQPRPDPVPRCGSCPHPPPDNIIQYIFRRSRVNPNAAPGHGWGVGSPDDRRMGVEPRGQGARLPSRLPLLSLVVVPEPICSPAASSLSEAAERGRESGERTIDISGCGTDGDGCAWATGEPSPSENRLTVN